MKFFVGADHAGFELKRHLIDFLKNKSISVEDFGTNSSESCDYPDFAVRVCQSVLKTPGSLGLLICGSGIGMSIAANKVRGIRAAVVSDEKSAALARQHNNAQILCLGARIVNAETAERCLDAFMTAQFESSHLRHQRRIDLITKIEEN